MKRFLPLLVLFGILESRMLAEPAVRIDATPKVQLALYGKTTQVYLKLTIPKNPQNRSVCVAVDGGIYRSSCWEVRGREGAFRQEWWVRGLTEGGYVVTAVLVRADGSEAKAETTFCVAGGPGGCGLGDEP